MFKNLKTVVKTSIRKRRSCNVIEPSANEHHFEEYCARINSIKEYLIAIKQSLNVMDDYTMETRLHLEDIIAEYDFILDNDLMSSVDHIDIDLLNNFIESPQTTNAELRQAAYSSQEYIELVKTLEIVQNTTQDILSLMDSTRSVSWWLSMNSLHLTTYTRMIDDRKCYGFGDCLAVVMVVLNEVINDYPDSIQVVDAAVLTLAKESVLKILKMEFNAPLNNYSSIWALVEPLYSITIEVEENTSWCGTSPEFSQQPEEFVYAEIGSDTELICKAKSNDAVYEWYKNGFPVMINEQTLNLKSVDVKNEGQYHCAISNNIGTTLSVVSNVLVYTSPKIIYSPTNQTTYEGNEDDAVFVCNATGYPTPLYEWYYSINGMNNWTSIKNGSNELLVYKPTQSDEGWYRCQASVYDHVTDPSSMAYLHIVGANISNISHVVEFQMAICSSDEIYKFSGSGNYKNGLHLEIEKAIMRSDVWLYGFIENMKAEINTQTHQLDVLFHLSTHYQYSVNMKIVDQAKEADERNQELLNIWQDLKIRLQDSSLLFEYGGDFFYAFPETFSISDTIYKCEEGKKLMNNSFICRKYTIQ